MRMSANVGYVKQHSSINLPFFSQGRLKHIVTKKTVNNETTNVWKIVYCLQRRSFIITNNLSRRKLIVAIFVMKFFLSLFGLTVAVFLMKIFFVIIWLNCHSLCSNDRGFACYLPQGWHAFVHVGSLFFFQLFVNQLQIIQSTNYII